MAGKALLLAGVLALACVASASVQSVELDHEGECMATCMLTIIAAPPVVHSAS